MPTRRPDAAAERLRRRAVLEHARSGPRRVFAPVVHAGTPGAGEEKVARFATDAGTLDQALRVDVVEALLRRVPGAPLVWLVRAGRIEQQHDADLAWACAVRAAGAELGHVPPMGVVTRHGWHEPLTGATRRWQRLRG